MKWMAFLTQGCLKLKHTIPPLGSYLSYSPKRNGTAQYSRCGTTFERLTNMIMSFSDYAFSISKSRQYIHKLYTQGRLKKALIEDPKTGKIMINKKIADNILNGDRLNSEEIESHEKLEEEYETKSYEQSKRMKIFYEAKQEKVKFEKEIKKLVSQEDVDKQALTSALIFRDKMLSIPTRIAPMLVGKTSIFEIKNILIEYITSVLEGISNINDSNFLKEVSE